MKLVSRISVAALALGLSAAPAAAQLAGLPVYNYAPAAAGVTVSGMFGKGLNDASGKTSSVGGMLTYGANMFWVGAGASYYDMSSGGYKEATFGGNVGINLPLGPDLPVKVAIVGGAGYGSKSGVKDLFIPAGVTLALKVPASGISVVPWISPQFRYMREDDNGEVFSQSKFGGSGGISFGLPMGVGIDLTVDYTNISGGSPFLGGVGLHYTFKTGG
jgi:hypothetical protein